MRRLLFLAFILAGACSDALEQRTTAGQFIAVANANADTLSLLSASDFTSSDVSLGSIIGKKPRVASRGAVVLVTSESSYAVTVDLNRRPYQPNSSGPSNPSGGAIQDDSIVWIASSSLNTVERLNYRTGAFTQTLAGFDPKAVVITAGKVFILDANHFSDTLRSYVSVVDPSTVTREDSILLSGNGAHHMALGDDSLLYAVNSGVLSDTIDGKLSIVDPVARKEIVVINGLGRGAGPAVFHPSGRLLIASSVSGILEVNTLTRSLTRGPTNPILAGRLVSGLAIDERRRIYAMDPDNCVVHVLSPPPDYDELRTVTLGGCPYSAATANTP